MDQDIDLPQVDVIWWNAESVCVRCPCCEKTNRHGFSSYASQKRLSHCGSGQSYQFAFPIDEKTQRVAYEIDKSKARFVNVCTLKELEQDLGEEDQLANQFFATTISSSSSTGAGSDENMYKAAEETVTVDLGEGRTFEQKTIDFAVSDCVTGRAGAVQNFLDISPDAAIFLRGRDYSGDTTIIMASCEKNSDMVSLLLDRGADVNAVNTKGRSALMEAALWGRLENAKILIRNGADRNLRDSKKRTAADLAQPTRENRNERQLRAGGGFGRPAREPIYKEDTFGRNADRREILRLLTDNKNIKHKTVYGDAPTAPQCKDYSFRRSPETQGIVLRGPLENYPVTNRHKAVARLQRGGQFPTIAAMSGWGHSEWRSIRVDGRDWTNEVMHIAEVVGHTLAPDDYDQGVPGQFQASHAEKQLIAYFVNRHFFLPRDQVPDAKLEASIKELEDRITDIFNSSATVNQLDKLEEDKQRKEAELFEEDDRLREDEYNEEKVQQLRADIQDLEKKISQLEPNAEVKRVRELGRQVHVFEQRKALHQKVMDMSRNRPPATLTRSTILVSAFSFTICDDCKRFKDRVNQYIRSSVELFECTNRS